VPILAKKELQAASKAGNLAVAGAPGPGGRREALSTKIEDASDLTAASTPRTYGELAESDDYKWWWAPPAILKSKCFRDKRGVALVVVALLLMPVSLLSALFLDVARLYAVRARMQAAADAAVLAAASGLIDGDDKGDSVRARAQHYVAMNIIGSAPALLDSLTLNTDAGTVSLVLKHRTGSLLLAPGGVIVRMAAQAGVQQVKSGEIGRPIPQGNAFGWWKKDQSNPGAKDSAVVKLSG
jgi:hypothetical protein